VTVDPTRSASSCAAISATLRTVTGDTKRAAPAGDELVGADPVVASRTELRVGIDQQPLQPHHKRDPTDGHVDVIYGDHRTIRHLRVLPYGGHEAVVVLGRPHRRDRGVQLDEALRERKEQRGGRGHPVRPRTPRREHDRLRHPADPPQGRLIEVPIGADEPGVQERREEVVGVRGRAHREANGERLGRSGGDLGRVGRGRAEDVLERLEVLRILGIREPAREPERRAHVGPGGAELLEHALGRAVDPLHRDDHHVTSEQLIVAEGQTQLGQDVVEQPGFRPCLVAVPLRLVVVRLQSPDEFVVHDRGPGEEPEAEREHHRHDRDDVVAPGDHVSDLTQSRTPSSV
jgi:hypothetical protein